MSKPPEKAALVFLVAAFSLLGLTGSDPALAQRSQAVDRNWSFQNDSPAWQAGSGPQIIFSIKESDFIKTGLHEPLAALARSDGFRTEESDPPLSPVTLQQGSILVLINPYLRSSYRDYPAMLPPSVYADEEIAGIRQWVGAGGALLVIADHAPYGGGSSALAEAFGFSFINGHAIEDAAILEGMVRVRWGFEAGTGLNTGHPVTDGGMGRHPVTRFFAFGGQAFLPPEQATVLLRFPKGWTALFAFDAVREFRTAQRMDASGLAQGAVMDYGKGRVAVFTEAGAFSAQLLPDGRRIGFNTPEGQDNPEFVLSLLRWLSGYRPQR